MRPTDTPSVDVVVDVAVDVVVVGAGLGGVSAALRAAEAGLRVTLIEAGATIGGTAYYSGGGVHIWGAETWDDYRRHSPLSDPALTRALFDGFRPYIDWLATTGAPGSYARTVIRGLGLLKYQLGRTMAPWARRRWFDHVVRRFEALGGTVVTGARARRLLRDGGGRIGGVVFDHQGCETRIVAPAVILAAGGFQAAPDLLSRYIGIPAEAFVQRSVATDVGDGLRLAVEAGAATTPSMDSIYGHLMPAPPCRIDWRDPMAPITLSAFYAQHGIVVNRAGRRFVDESAGELDGTTINAAARQPPGLWVVIDDRVRRGAARYEVPAELVRLSSLRYVHLLRHARIHWQGGRWQGARWQGGRPRLFLDTVAQAEHAGARIVRADSLADLAARLADDVDPVALVAEIAAYNAALASGQGAGLPIARTGNLHRIAQPPFLAIKVGVGVSMTYGGVAIDVDARALDGAGRAVPGLYAVPGTAGGIHHLNYAGALAACGVFGMIAADTLGRDRVSPPLR